VDGIETIEITKRGIRVVERFGGTRKRKMSDERWRRRLIVHFSMKRRKIVCRRRQHVSWCVRKDVDPICADKRDHITGGRTKSASLFPQDSCPAVLDEGGS
jgi:hypothetical protein